jgi:hypothetical protein
MTASNSRGFRERRQSPRLDILDRLEVRLLAGTPVVLPQNLGAGGFSVSSSAPFSVGAVHRFVITPRGGGPATALAAKVVYCHGEPGSSTRFVSGFAFVTPTERELEKIEGLLDAMTGSLSFD